MIIYHDILPPSRWGSHVKSDHAHTIIQHTPLSPYTRHISSIFRSYGLFSVHTMVNRHHVTASNPSSGDNPPERARAVRENAKPTKNCRIKLNHLLLPIFRVLSSSLHRHPSVAQHHPSNLTSVYPIPAPHLHPPLTPFQSYGTKRVYGVQPSISASQLGGLEVVWWWLLLRKPHSWALSLTASCREQFLTPLSCFLQSMCILWPSKLLSSCV